jgi:hypothetical protein
MPRPSWLARDVAIVLPLALVRAVFARAERFDTEKGGRFDRGLACVLIWSTWPEPGTRRPTSVCPKASRGPSNGNSASHASPRYPPVDRRKSAGRPTRCLTALRDATRDVVGAAAVLPGKPYRPSCRPTRVREGARK